MKVYRIAQHAAVLGLVVGALGLAQPTWADRAEGEAAIAEAAARWGVSAATMTAIVACETGRTWRNDLVGRQGERGPAQLLPGAGNGLAQFYAMGYSDPESWWESMQFMARTIAAGGRGQWHC